jgi:hypothetical protein
LEALNAQKEKEKQELKQHIVLLKEKVSSKTQKYEQILLESSQRLESQESEESQADHVIVGRNQTPIRSACLEGKIVSRSIKEVSNAGTTDLSLEITLRNLYFRIK